MHNQTLEATRLTPTLSPYPMPVYLLRTSNGRAMPNWTQYKYEAAYFNVEAGEAQLVEIHLNDFYGSINAHEELLAGVESGPRFIRYNFDTTAAEDDARMRRDLAMEQRADDMAAIEAELDATWDAFLAGAR